MSGKYCTHCGSELQFPEAEICPKCGMRLREPPKIYVPYHPDIPSAGSYAGFWTRFGAYVIDLIIVFLLYFGFLITFALISPALYQSLLIKTTTNMSQSGNPFAIMLAPVYWIFWIMWLGYFTLQESSSVQATLGKRALKIKVVDAAGNTISSGQSALRNLLKFIPFVGFLCCIVIAFSAKKQGLHDMAANTFVVPKQGY